MTAGHERKLPEERASNFGPIDDVEITEFGDTSESIRIFDTAREEMYLQVSRIILGGGGDTRAEAMEVLSYLHSNATTQFGAMCAKLYEDAETPDEAIHAIATLYDKDQINRFTILQRSIAQAGSNEIIEFEMCDRTDILGMLNTVLSNINSELEDEVEPEVYDDTDGEAADISYRYASHHTEFYDKTLSNDFKAVLAYAAPNKSELRSVNNALRRDRIMGTIANAGMMVGTSALTVLGMVLVDKHRK